MNKNSNWFIAFGFLWDDNQNKEILYNVHSYCKWSVNDKVKYVRLLVWD